jgi:hypothetical protein
MLIICLAKGMFKNCQTFCPLKRDVIYMKHMLTQKLVHDNNVLNALKTYGTDFLKNL